MAFYTGYITLPTISYDAWKLAVAGNGYDADGAYGDQCWDLCAEFWWNIGFPQGYPQTGVNHSAYECWTVSKDANKAYNGTTYFDLIYNFSDVKKGDVIVYADTPAVPSGHIGFADEDYNGTSYIHLLGQNQGNTGIPTPIPNPLGGTTATVSNLETATNFLGAFRYRNWHQPVPPTPTSNPQSNFKWVLYARKLRQKQNNL